MVFEAVSESGGSCVLGPSLLPRLRGRARCRTAHRCWALIGVLFVFTVTELLLSPVGLSASTKLAPKVFYTQMVALFFLSVALGTAMAGVLAGYYTEDDQVTYFSLLGGVTIVVGIALFAVTKPIEKMMEGVR